MSEKDRFKLVEIGFGGTVGHISRGGTVSGWRSADEIAPQLAEGAYIIDKRPALDSEGTGFPDARGVSRSVMAPMVDVDLSPAQIAHCPEIPAFMLSEFGLQGEFRTVAALHTFATADTPEPGPLDYVSIEDHLARWAGWGARIGRKVNGQIVWAE